MIDTSPDKRSPTAISVCIFSVHIVSVEPVPFIFQLTYFVSLESAYLTGGNVLTKQEDPTAWQSVYSQLPDKKHTQSTDSETWMEDTLLDLSIDKLFTWKWACLQENRNMKIGFIWLRNSPVAGYGNEVSGSIRVQRTTLFQVRSLRRKSRYNMKSTA